jgi:hypothetical protein
MLNPTSALVRLMLYAIKEIQMAGVVYAIMMERQRLEPFRAGEQQPWQQGQKHR